MNLKKIKIISIIGILILSFISHFMYDLFPNIIFSFIFPVNESIWEHMKILDKYLLNKYNIKHNNFPFQLYFTAISSIPLYLAIYIPIYKLLGEKLIISLLLLLIVYIIEAYISYNLLKEKELKVLNLLAVLIILSTYIFFIYLTYNPPHNYIFYDTIENKYSINDYTNKISTS